MKQNKRQSKFEDRRQTAADTHEFNAQWLGSARNRLYDGRAHEDIGVALEALVLWLSYVTSEPPRGIELRDSMRARGCAHLIWLNAQRCGLSISEAVDLRQALMNPEGRAHEKRALTLVDGAHNAYMARRAQIDLAQPTQVTELEQRVLDALYHSPVALKFPDVLLRAARKHGHLDKNVLSGALKELRSRGMVHTRGRGHGFSITELGRAAYERGTKAGQEQDRVPSNR